MEKSYFSVVDHEPRGIYPFSGLFLTSLPAALPPSFPAPALRGTQTSGKSSKPRPYFPMVSCKPSEVRGELHERGLGGSGSSQVLCGTKESPEGIDPTG